MGGFERVLRRMTMAALACGLVFGLPNVGQAQTPQGFGAQGAEGDPEPQLFEQISAARLPWQTASFPTNSGSYDKDWTRVLSDMQQMLRRFSASYPYAEALKIDAAKQTPLWVANVPTYVPPAPEPIRVDVGALRATLTPVEFTSGAVTAESRSMQGVLVGAQVEMVD
jgi:hypothetical protein